LGRSVRARNAEALREFKQYVMGAQKTPVSEQSECQKSALARAFSRTATKKTDDYLTPFTRPAAIPIESIACTAVAT
jgi:hypothetical protein